MTYNTSNGAKPRFDGAGTEFGLMHRDLGPSYLMFDIDRMSATIEANLELKREEEGFVEYRRSVNKITFVAMFEVKANRTNYSQSALNPNDSNALARAEMARLIGARLFVVFATNGRQPFDFYEIDTTTREAVHIGTLDYSAPTRSSACQAFWRNVLGIDRYF